MVVVSFLLQESLVLCSFPSHSVLSHPVLPVSSHSVPSLLLWWLSPTKGLHLLGIYLFCWDASQSSSYFRKFWHGTRDTGHGTPSLFRLKLNLNPPPLASLVAVTSDLCHHSWLFFFKGTIYWIISSHPLEGIPEGITGRDHKEERIKLDSVWLFITLPDSDAKVVYRRHI